MQIKSSIKQTIYFLICCLKQIKLKKNKISDLIKFDLSPDIKIADKKKINKKRPIFLYFLLLIKAQDEIKLKLKSIDPAFNSSPMKPETR